MNLESTLHEIKQDLALIKQRLGIGDEDIDDHERRLRGLEKRSNFVIGACVVLSALGAWQALGHALHLGP